MRGNEFHGMEISYAVQRIPAGRTKPLGTADALLCALRVRSDWRGTTFTVCNSDNLYSRNVLNRLIACGHICALIDYDREALGFEPSRIRDSSGRVGVSMNIFRFAYDTVLPFLEEVPLHPVRMEKELPVAVARMIEKSPRSVLTIPVSEYVPDLTGRGDIAVVQEYMRTHYPGSPGL